MTTPVGRTTFISPVLVGRDHLLELADRRLTSAAAGNGQMLLLAGEAGIGKTRLMGAISRRASLAGFRPALAAAFPGDVDLAGGLLLDLARGLARAEEPAAAAELGRRIEDRLLGAGTEARSRPRADGAGDAHRTRRLLVLDLADLIAELAASVPTALLLEDLHWADDLSLEVLGQLARRLGQLPALVLGTYRSDELYPRVPLREWRTRLLNGRLADEASLARLGDADLATMAAAVLGSELPVPSDLVDALRARCDGIPLHVEELLAALGHDDPSGSRLRNQSVPETLAEAILQRAGSLSAGARRVADAAALVGREFDTALLSEITGDRESAVALALVELIERQFLVRATQADRLDFRHALIRDALHDGVPDFQRRELHRRIAVAASQRPDLGNDAFLSMQYAGALMGPEAYRLSMSAGRRAAAMSAHREAAELFDRARRFLDAGASAHERAAVSAAFAAEAAALDDNAAAHAGYDEARTLLAAAGDPLGAAALAVPHVAVRHLLGDGLEARVAVLDAALASIAGLDGPDAAQVRASIEGGLSAAFMLDRRLDESIDHGSRALAVAPADGDIAAASNASTTLGAVYLFAGRMDEGWRLLEDAIQTGRAAGLEAEAARSYRMLGTSASVLVEYDRAERSLGEGIEFAHRVELWNHQHYMAAHLGHVAWATGDWPAAHRLAEHALADGRGGITTRITCLHVLGYVAMGRGDWPAAEGNLGEARELGLRMGELQRASPAIWGLAEIARLRGDNGLAVELSEQGVAASENVRDAAYAFPFLVTGTRAVLALGDPLGAERWVERVATALADRSIPGALPAIDHGRGLVLLAQGSSGRARTMLETAAEGWRTRRRAWEGAWALLDLGRAAHRSNQRVEAGRFAAAARERGSALGSPPLIAAADELLNAIGRRDADAPPEPWAPLTAREFSVARLIADGLTNGEIATELTIAPKTVAAHVEHILAKLGVGRRAEIAAWAAGISVLHSRPHGRDREE
jgi:DNA-binding CsgD family transcriptional regulator/tetratricopeptide (TPR) repeat protein